MSKKSRLTGVAALCTLGVLAASPAAFAADDTAKMAIPGADVTKLASKYRTSVAEVLKRQAQLAPAIKALAPNANQPLVQPRLKSTRIAKAAVDECFIAVGSRTEPDANGNCAPGTTPRRNQSYVFGTARSGDYSYFGTLANPLCNTGNAYNLKITAFSNEYTACEFNDGWAGRTVGFKVFGDVRRPEVFRTNADTGKTENITPTEEQAPNLKYNYGLRGQGALDDVVLLGGISMSPLGNGTYAGVEFLAYEGSTGKFLGSKVLPQYANLRRGNVIDGDLYFGVRLNNGANGTGGGVIKWTGDKTDPFKFEVVANNLPSEPGYITGHEHHIITSGFTTVSRGQVTGATAEMYQSPEIPEGGLTAATSDPSNWKSIFKMTDYDPDPELARGINFGDLISFKGKLMFSTYAYGGFATVMAFDKYGKPADELGRINTYLNAERSIALLSMENVGKPNQKVNLLYGDKTLPVFNTTTKQWERKPNKLGQTPKFGPAGYGNRFNYYSWMWEMYKGNLYMSTFDASSMAKTATPIIAGAPLLGLSDLTIKLLDPVMNAVWNVQGGGDVWRMSSPDLPAVSENLDGFGNKNSHGVRGWTAFEDKGKLLAGMATWATLDNDPKHMGGWEVNELKG